jgi:hypothetical protein
MAEICKGPRATLTTAAKYCSWGLGRLGHRILYMLGLTEASYRRVARDGEAI